MGFYAFGVVSLPVHCSPGSGYNLLCKGNLPWAGIHRSIACCLLFVCGFPDRHIGLPGSTFYSEEGFYLQLKSVGMEGFEGVKVLCEELEEALVPPTERGNDRSNSLPGT